MPTRSSLSAHLRSALAAAMLLGLCQVVAETVIVAARFQHFLLNPHVFFAAQPYDFSLKLFLLLPGAAEWLSGGMLDRFLPVGFFGKLGIAGALVVPNLLVGGVLGLLVGAALYLLRRPAGVLSALWVLVALALGVHLLSWILAIHIPKVWNARVVVRNTGRVFVWDGAFVALIVLAMATALTALIARLRPVVRWAVSLGAVLAFGVASLTLAPVTPASSEAAVREEAGVTRRPNLARIDNVILISIDSLRADRLGCYGHQRKTSPAMDRLARNGVRFENAMSTTSWTLPAHVSLLTGRYLLSHGVISEKDRIPEGVSTLAETLQSAGFSTAGIVAALFLDRNYGFDRGFDSYDESAVAPSKAEGLSAEPAPLVTDLAIKWLREHDRRRFFLFLHYWDVHYDYLPPPPYDTMFDPNYSGTVTGENFYFDRRIRSSMPQRDIEHLLALYDGEIRWVDDHIGQILAVVDELGIANRTAIIVTSDHGDEFFEHGYKGHTRTLYREVVHVPLIMRVPGITPGQEVEGPVGLADVMPTVLDLLAVDPPAGMNGNSLVPAMTGGQLANGRAVHAWLCSLKRKRNCQAMQDGGTGTLLYFFQPPRVEFYGPLDFAQRHDIASLSEWPRQQQLASLLTHLNSGWAGYRSLGGSQATVEIDKSTLERLRALGYVE